MNFTKYLFNGGASGVCVIKGIESAKNIIGDRKKRKRKGVIFGARFNDLKSDGGPEIIKEEIQVGGLGGGPNRKNVLKNIQFIEDVAILTELLTKGIHVSSSDSKKIPNSKIN